MWNYLHKIGYYESFDKSIIIVITNNSAIIEMSLSLQAIFVCCIFPLITGCKDFIYKFILVLLILKLQAFPIVVQIQIYMK